MARIVACDRDGQAERERSKVHSKAALQGRPSGDNPGHSPTNFHRATMELTAVLTTAEEGGFIALNPETGTTTQGETIEEAVANLREATTLYLSEFPLRKTGHPVVTTFTVPVHA
jgi:predicted RNase H-like HicB family nuclease